MIVILYDRSFRRGAASGEEFSLSASAELLNAPYLDRLAEQYRRLGAREVVWADLSPNGGERPPLAGGAGWRRVAAPSLQQGMFGRFETVFIADYRLWPEAETRDAIRKHRRSGSTLTVFAQTPGQVTYQELMTAGPGGDGCVVARRYGAGAAAGQQERHAALLARPKSLCVVWGKALDALSSGDIDRLVSLTSSAQLRVAGSPPFVDTPDDYLALSGALVARAGEVIPGARSIGDGIWAMGGASVDPGCQIRGPVLLGEGCRVEAGTSIAGPVVIGNSVRIGPDCFVGESVLFNGASVPRRARIWRSVVEGGAEVLADRVVSFMWVSEEGCRRYVPTTSRVRFSSVVVPSRRVLRRCRPRAYGAAKRLMDIAGASAGIALTLPLYPLIALAIKLESAGPVFFVHRRQTVGGREFGCLKFRSMVPNALTLRNQLRNEVDGPQFHVENDQRLTRVGKFLRKTNLDEVPQFWNVLWGHMSLVGPRPSPDDENQLCPAWREARLSVRPGLTGMWQLRRTDRATGDFHQWIQYDTQYVREVSLRTDLKLLWETMLGMLKRL